MIAEANNVGRSEVIDDDTEMIALLDSGATVHIISDSRLLDMRFNQPPPLWMTELQTASQSLNVQNLSALVIKLKDINNQEFIYRAPCLYVPDLQSEHLLSYSQMVSCSGCKATCKQKGSTLDNIVTTLDARGRAKTFKTLSLNGLFHVPYSLCSESEKLKLGLGATENFLEFHHLTTESPQATVIKQGNNVYLVRANPTNGIDEAGFLHGVFGHTSAQRIKDAFDCGGLTGKTFGSSELRSTFIKDCAQFECPACSMANKRKATTPETNEARSQYKPFHLMHADIVYLMDEEAEKVGPLDCFLPDETPPKYALIMVDDASRYTFVQPMYRMDTNDLLKGFLNVESECRAMIAKIINDPMNHNSPHGFTHDTLDNPRISVIKHIHSDNGSVFRANFGSFEGEDRQILGVKGLEKLDLFDNNPFWTHSESYRQHQNGVVERKIGDLKQHALRVRAAAGVGHRGRFFALHYAAFNLNLVSTNLVDERGEAKRDTPFRFIFRRPYNVNTRPLRAFGSLGFKKLYNQSRKGAMPREPVLFLTYPSYPKRGYIVSEMFQNKAGGMVANVATSDIVTRDWAWMKTPLSITIKILEDFIGLSSSQPPELIDHIGEAVLEQVIASNSANDIDDDYDEYEDALEHFSVEEEDEAAASFLSANEMLTDNEEFSEFSSSQSILKAMTIRTTDAPTFKYTISETIKIQVPPKKPDSSRAIPPLQKSGTWKMSRDWPKNSAMALAIRIGKEGEKVKKIEDFTDDQWKAAELLEWRGFVHNNVLKLGFCPLRTRKLDFKAVKKVRNDNSLKVRLTVRGFKQTKNVNYYNKYSPVVSPSVIRMVISISISMGLPLWAADIKQAFLQAELSEDIWVDIPKGYEYDKSKGNAFKLLKSVYGSMQASRNWFIKLRDALKSCGFQQSRKEPCLFFKHDANKQISMIVTTLVDDILAIGSEKNWGTFIKELSEKVELEHDSISEAKEYCGITLRRVNEHRMELSQDKYTLEMIDSYANQYDWKPRKAELPLRKYDADHLLHPMTESVAVDSPEILKARIERYQSLLGSLLWLAIWTRCDISQAVGLAGRRAKAPSKEHLDALENILSYVSTNQKSLIFDCNDCVGRLSLAAFSDADYAGDTERFKSTTGYAVMLSGCLTSWSSKLQTVVSLSTAQAETNAAVDCLREMKFQTHILNEMGLAQKLSPLFIDNRATIDRMMRNTPTPTTKHEGIRASWLHEAVMDEELVWPFFVATDDNLADIFTKGSVKGGIEQFCKLRDLLQGSVQSKSIISFLTELIVKPGSIALDSKMTNIYSYLNQRGKRDFRDRFI